MDRSITGDGLALGIVLIITDLTSSLGNLNECETVGETALGDAEDKELQCLWLVGAVRREEAPLLSKHNY
jgi:hypothetical protein